MHDCVRADMATWAQSVGETIPIKRITPIAQLITLFVLLTVASNLPLFVSALSADLFQVLNANRLAVPHPRRPVKPAQSALPVGRR